MANNLSFSATIDDSKLQETLNSIEKRIKEMPDLTVTVKLDGGSGENLKAISDAVAKINEEIKSKVDKKNNAVIISTKLADNWKSAFEQIDRQIASYRDKTVTIETHLGSEKLSSRTLEQAKTQMGTGPLSAELKQAQELAEKLVAEVTKIQGKLAEGKDNKWFAFADGGKDSPVGLLTQLNTLLIEARKNAADIDPKTLETGLRNIQSTLTTLNLDGVTKKFQAGLDEAANNIKRITTISEQGQGGISSSFLGIESSIASAVNNIKLAVSEMTGALKNDNLTAFAKRAEEAGAAIDKLAQAIGGFNNVAVNQEGMRDLLTGLGMLINNLKNITGENVIRGALVSFEQYEKGIQRITDKIGEIDQMREKLQNVQNMTLAAGVQTSQIPMQLQALDDYRQKLVELARVEKSDWNANAVTRALGVDYTELKRGSDEALRYAESVRIAANEETHLTQVLANYKNISSQLNGRKLDSSDLDAYIKKIENALERFREMRKGGELGAEQALRSPVLNKIMIEAQAAAQKATQSLKEDDIRVKALESIKKNARDAGNEMGNLGRKIGEVNALLQRNAALPSDLRIDTTQLEEGRRQLIYIQSLLKDIKEGRSTSSVNDVMKEVANYNALRDAAVAASSALERIKKSEILDRKNQAERSFKSISDMIRNMEGLSDSGAKLRIDTTALDEARQKILPIAAELANIMNGNGTRSVFAVMNDQANIQAIQNALMKIESLRTDIANKGFSDKNMNDAQVQYDRIQRSLEEIDRLLTTNGGLKTPFDTTELTAARGVLEQIQNTYKGIAGGTDSQSAQKFKGLAKTIDDEARATLALAEARSAINAQARKEGRKTTITDEEAKNIKDAIAGYKSLYNEIKRLEGIRTTAKTFGIDTTELERSISVLQNYFSRLGAIMNGGSKDSAKGIMDINYERARAEAVANGTRIDQQNTDAKRAAKDATSKLTEEEQRLAKAIQDANNAGRQQHQVLSDLQNMAMQYLSVYAAQNFVKEMANITGELELQKKSLEVILNSASMAQQLYGQIQSLSQESPYTFQDLLKSTRQLAAFGVETKDLYGTMKAISDIGAGLSVDVNRLILAFGHTRSYGYLSGIQNRQFENAGIDLMGELMKLYNSRAAQDEAAGRSATYVTRKDLFKRMRTRDISFEDVQNVVLGLDRPGGKFYNMQERQFETLGGKLRNLKNNYNIMMSEMGQANMGLLKGGVDIMNTLTADWQKYYNIILDVVVALGAAKAAQMAMGGSALKSFGAVQQQLTRDNITKSLLRGNTGWNVGQAYNRQGVAYGQAILDGNMSTLQKAKSVMFKNIDRDTREMVLRELGASEKYIARINSLSTKTGFLWARASLTMKFFAAEAKASMMALATNPMTWIFAAVGAVTAIVNRLSDAKQLQEKLMEDAQNAGKEDSASIDNLFKESEYVKRLNNSTRSINGVQTIKYGLEFDEKSILKHDPVQVLAEVTKQLQQYSPLYQGQIIDIMAVQDDIGKVKKAFESLNKAQYVDKIMASDNTVAQALSEGPKWYNLSLTDNFIEDLKDDKKSVTDLDAAIRNLTSTEKNYVLNVADDKRKQIARIGELTGEDRNAIIRRMVRNGSYVAESVNVGRGSRDDIKDDAKDLAETFVTNFRNYFNGDNEESAMYFQQWLNRMFSEAKISDAAQQMDITNILLQQMEAQGADGKRFAEYFRGLKLKEHFAEEIKGMVNENSSAADMQKALDTVTQKTLDWAVEQGVITGKISKEQGEKYARLFKEAFNAEMNSNTLQYDWQRRGIGFFNVNTTMKNNIKTVIDIDEFSQAVQKNLKEAQEYIKRNEGHIKTLSLKLGIKLDTKLDAEALAKVISAIRKNALEKLRKRDIKSADDLWDQAAELQNYLNALKSAEEDKAWLKSEGYPEKDKSKNKSKGNSKDKDLEALKERGRAIREAYELYKKYRGEFFAEADAIAQMKLEYGDMLKQVGFKEEDFASIPKYKEQVKKLVKSAQALYNSKHTEGRMAYLRELEKLFSTANFDTFKEQSDKALSLVQSKLEDITHKWDIFNKVREATGDVDFAQKTARFTTGEMQGVSNIVDSQKKLIKESLANFSTAKLDGLNLDEIYTMSEKQIQDLAGKVFSGEENAQYRDQIKTLIEELKKLKDAQLKLEEERASAMANALSSSELYIDKLAKINDEYKRQYDLISKMPQSPERDRALENIKLDRDTKSLKESYNYKRALSAVFTQTESEFNKFAEVIRKNLDKNLKAGKISAEEYANQIENINKKLRDISNKRSDISAYFSEGIDGMIKNMQARGKEQIEQGALKVQNGQDLINLANKNGDYRLLWQGLTIKAKGKEQISKGNSTLTKSNNLQAAISSIDTIINGINKSLQGLKKALDNFADELDYMGGDGNSIKDSNFYGMVSGMSKSSQGASDGWNAFKNGDVFGTIDGAVRSVTGLYTGVAQWHDDKLSREIKKLDDDVKKIQNELKQIDKRRERTLGYDADTKYYNSLISDYYSDAAKKDAEWRKKYLGETYIGEGAAGAASGAAVGAATGVTTGLAVAGTGALIGASVGSAVPVVGTIVGAAVGAIAGSIIGILSSKSSNEDKNQSKAYKAMAEYYEELNKMGNNGYEQEYNLLLQQRTDMMTQLNDEMNKKKKDDSAIQSLKEQIAELDDQIRYFKQDTMKELYGIDFKSWANQISDALMTAFENGEDAAKAYQQTVRSMLQGVVNNMLRLAVIEPYLSSLQTAVEKAFDLSDPEGSIEDIVEILTDGFRPGGSVDTAINVFNTALQETNDRLEAMGVSLRDVETIANEAFSIDVAGWASQMSDALTNAFYNGELAAESYGDTVRTIMQQVVNSMLQTAYITPMIKNLEKQLYGYTDEITGEVHQGAFNASNPSGSLAEVTKVLSDYFGSNGDGRAMITAATEMANAVEQVLNESGLSLKNTTGTNTRNAITNQATEETMGVVSGYLSAIRQDVSVQRIYMTQLAEQYAASVAETWTQNNNSIKSMDDNIANIYRAISEGDGALYRAIKDIRDDIHGSVDGTKSIKMR